jgi:hypothetical protein
MKPSDLKPGDHFTFTPGSGGAGIWRADGKGGAYCVSGNPDWRHDERADLSDRDGRAAVELVPMPAPYVIGKAYRARGGQKVTYEGATRGQLYDSGPYKHSFLQGASSMSTTPDGLWHAGGATDLDIMGEWIEETSTTKDPNMEKRTLPTVTLDQIFETLRAKDACWYKELGNLGLAKKLEALSKRVLGVIDDDKVSLRTLHNAVKGGNIGRDDAGWLVHATPAFHDPKPGTCHLGTHVFEKALDEWENPRPKYQKMGNLPAGTTFQYDNHPYVIVEASRDTYSGRYLEVRESDTEYAAVCNTKTGHLNYLGHDLPSRQISNIVLPGGTKVI